MTKTKRTPETERLDEEGVVPERTEQSGQQHFLWDYLCPRVPSVDHTVDVVLGVSG